MMETGEMNARLPAPEAQLMAGRDFGLGKKDGEIGGAEMENAILLA